MLRGRLLRSDEVVVVLNLVLGVKPRESTDETGTASRQLHPSIAVSKSGCDIISKPSDFDGCHSCELFPFDQRQSESIGSFVISGKIFSDRLPSSGVSTT